MKAHGFNRADTEDIMRGIDKSSLLRSQGHHTSSSQDQEIVISQAKILQVPDVDDRLSLQTKLLLEDAKLSRESDALEAKLKSNRGG